MRGALCRSEYHGTNVGDVREASNKPVRLVTDRYPVQAGVRQFEYRVSHARRDGSVTSQLVVLVRWIADVDSTDVWTVAHHDDAFPLIQREFEIFNQRHQ
ncbi:hypothetical protein AYM40_08650 [Paraburkholderia phytofirmans OLGA172]|uniref:Uncharacterized protein n=1 Tax=Paraburkholderia phytofirmans OLGA172 TaxID=1417228 RepID=A0A160FJE7_9BURK|nr:hypothetical protein AYM40_08650 [Paraburkholderia phytofirmans OLGA172]